MMSKKRNSIIALIAAIALIGAGIAGYYLTRTRYEKYTESMLDVFDTVITLVAYTKDEAEFTKYFDHAYDRLHELHKLYDFYNSYEGINNIVTINENAGKAPVAVDRQIIDMILFAKDYYERTGGKTNIAMGSVLSIWHRYRDDGIDDPDNAKLPDMQELVAASLHTDINNVIVDEANGTVYLSDPLMSLDVGAVAKGYATELVADELIAMGMSSGMLNSGGNVKSAGKPMDGIRQRWGVGVQDPDAFIFSDDEDLSGCDIRKRRGGRQQRGLPALLRSRRQDAAPSNRPGHIDARPVFQGSDCANRRRGIGRFHVNCAFHAAS